MPVKYKQIADSLHQYIQKQAAAQGEDRLPTEQELMRRFQVSRQTVRQALLVLTEEGLIEKRQGSGTYIAASLRSPAASSHTAAILTPSPYAYGFSSMLWEMQSILSEAGYPSQIFSTDNQLCQERVILETLLTHPVRGLLVQATRNTFPNPNLDLYRRLVQNGTSVLFLGDAYTGLEEFPCVRSDDYAGGYLLASHLIRQSHTRIGGIFQSDSISGIQRHYGCICALRDNHLSFDDQHFLWFEAHRQAGSPDALLRSALSRYLETQLTDMTALLCQDEETAAVLIQELLRLHIQIPAQISVACFENGVPRKFGSVPVSTLSLGETRLWQIAAHGLLQLMNGFPFTALPFTWTLLPSCPNIRGPQ